MHHKLCKACQLLKPKDDFYFSNSEKTRYSADCKSCHNQKALLRRQDPLRRWAIEVRYRLKLTESIEQLIELYEHQQGKCAICGGTNDTHRLHLDHNHSTGKVREFLCRGCNSGLGHFKENVDTMRKAIEYIAKHEKL